MISATASVGAATAAAAAAATVWPGAAQGLQVLDALIVLDAVLVQIRDIADDNGAGALKLVKAPIGMLKVQLNVEFLEWLGDIDAGIAGADLLIPVGQTLHRFLHLPLRVPVNH